MLLAGNFARVMGVLDVHFINTLPVLVASRHSRESGNPGDERHGDWMPAYAGMTFYWRRTYETDIQPCEKGYIPVVRALTV